jgi:Bacterial SH3 domain
MQNPTRFCFLIIFLVFFSFQSHSQVKRLASVYHPGSRLYVSVYAGLSLRDTPSTAGKVLTVVKYGEPVTVVADGTKPVPITNSGIPGQWVKVKYGELTGYQFDGFLSRFATMEQHLDVRSYSLFQEYLKTQFKVESYNLTEQDTTGAGEYLEECKFVNGIAYKRNGVEYAYTFISFPASVITFQEVYFMARGAYPTVFYGKDSKCDYNEGNIKCEFIQQPLLIVQEGDRILLKEGLEGY